MRAHVESDGITVWVNASTGDCIGRFGRNGIDIHRTVQDQMDGKDQCLFCTHAPVTRDEWELFKVKMLELYRVTVTDEHMPERMS